MFAISLDLHDIAFDLGTAAGLVAPDKQTEGNSRVRGVT
jgi:hypothetical protein